MCCTYWSRNCLRLAFYSSNYLQPDTVGNRSRLIVISCCVNLLESQSCGTKLQLGRVKKKIDRVGNVLFCLKSSVRFLYFFLLLRKSWFELTFFIFCIHFFNINSNLIIVGLCFLFTFESGIWVSDRLDKILICCVGWDQVIS